MKIFLFVIMLALTASSTIGAVQVDFVDSYEQALEQASKKKQNMVITFYTDW